MRFQKKKNTCGPAALANALKCLGKNVNEERLVKLCGTDEHGTDEKNLKQGIQKMNFCFQVLDCRNWSQAWQSLSGVLAREPARPVILCVDKDTHWVVAFGRLGLKINIFDSEPFFKNRQENGVHVLNQKQLKRRWRGPKGGYYALAVFLP